MFYFIQNEDNELSKITQEQYERIKSSTDIDVVIINPIDGCLEWVDPITDTWEVLENIEDYSL